MTEMHIHHVQNVLQGHTALLAHQVVPTAHLAHIAVLVHQVVQNVLSAFIKVQGDKKTVTNAPMVQQHQEKGKQVRMIARKNLIWHCM
jgi:hypothetical protein